MTAIYLVGSGDVSSQFVRPASVVLGNLDDTFVLFVSAGSGVGYGHDLSRRGLASDFDDGLFRLSQRYVSRFIEMSEM